MSCTPIRNFGVLFERNSSHISSQQVLLLGTWIANTRIRYPNREAIYLSGSADEKERNPAELARARVRALQAMLDDLRFTADRVYTDEKVEVMKAGSFGPGIANDVKRADLQLLPGCPHECECQAN